MGSTWGVVTFQHFLFSTRPSDERPFLGRPAQTQIELTTQKKGWPTEGRAQPHSKQNKSLVRVF